MSNNFSQSLEIYRKTGEICSYLNITENAKWDLDNLAGKFAFLEAQEKSSAIFHLSSLGHQITVPKCAFAHYLDKIKSDSYYNNTLIWYDQKGVMLPFLPWIILPSIFALISILLNLSLIIVTVNKISLSKLCNSLILFDSICQIPVVFPFLINFCALIFGIPHIHFNVCLFALMFSAGCSYASFLAIFFISLERLLIIQFPMRMHFISPSTIKIFSLLSSIICLIFGTFASIGVFNVWTIINLPYYRSLFCNTGLYSDVLNNPISYSVLSLTLLNYSLIFAKFLCQQRGMTNSSGGNEQNVGTRRTLRSVLIISGVLLIGWVLISAARNLITDLIRSFSNWIVHSILADQFLADSISANLANILISIVTCLSIITSGMSAPILIACSSEYRNAYKSTFSRIFSKKESAVGPLFTIQQQWGTRSA